MRMLFSHRVVFGLFFLDLVRTYNDVPSFLVKSKLRDLTQRYSGLGFNRGEVVVVCSTSWHL